MKLNLTSLALMCVFVLGCEAPPVAGADSPTAKRTLANISPTTYAGFATAVVLHERSDQFLKDAGDTRSPAVRRHFQTEAVRTWQQALRYYRSAAFRDPRSALIQRRMAEGYLRRGEVDLARKHFEASVRNDDGDFATLFRLAALYEREGRRKELISTLAKAVEARPDELKTFRLPQVILNLARLCEQEGDDEQATAVYERFLKLDTPSDVRDRFDQSMRRLMESPYAVHLKLGRLYRKLGKHARSGAAYLAVCKLRADLVQALYEAASSFRDAGDYPRALELCREYIAKLPDQPNGHGLLIDIYDRMGEPAKAVAAAEELLRDKPAFHKLRLRLGQLYEKKGRLDKAVAQYERVVRDAPKFAPAYVRLTDVEAKSKRFGRMLARLRAGMSAGVEDPSFYAELDRRIRQSAKRSNIVKRFEDAVPADERDYAFYYMLGQLHQRGGRLAEGAEAFRKTIELKPDYHYAYIRLGALYSGMERFDAAADVLAEGAKRFPKDLMIWRLLADARRADDDLDGAIDAMKYALDINPTSLGNGMLLARLMHRAGRDREVEKLFDDRLKDDPEHALHWTCLAASYHIEISRKYDRAIEVLERAVRTWPENGLLLSTLGVAYARGGRYGEAVTTLRDALRRDPGNVRILGALVAALERARRLDEAEKELRDWVARGPDEPQLKEELALFLIRNRRNPDEGLKLIKTLAGADPDDVERNLRLAYAYRELDRHKEAAGVLKKLLKKHPDNDNIRYSLAIAYDDMKDHARAERILREFLKKDPRAARAANALGYMFAERGIRLDEAEKLIAVALDDEPENGAYLDSMGWVYFRKGDLRKALDYLKRAAEAEPDDPVIVEHLGDVYAKLGQASLALESYENAVRRDPFNVQVPEKIRRLREGKDPFVEPK